MPRDIAISEFGRAERWRSLVAVIASVFGVGVSFGALVPLIALILERRGVDAAVIGLNSAMFPLAVLLFTPHLPHVAARLGTMASMLLGLAVTVGAVLLLPILPQLWAWFALRFVIGAGVALHWLVSETWMNLVATERNRGTIMGVYATVLAGGFALGPVLLQVTGTEGWFPFLFAAAAIAASALPLLLGIGLAPPLSAHRGRSMWRMLRLAPVAMAAALAGGLTDAAAFVLLPLYGLRVGFEESTAVLLLTVFTAGNLVLQIPIGWLADRVPRRRVLMGCACVGVIGSALLPATLGSPALLWALLFIWGGTIFAFYTVGLSLLGQSFPAGQFAAANASFIVLYELGSVTGPVIGGAAMDVMGPHGMLVMVGGAALGFLLVAAFGPAPRSAQAPD
ncbi:MAG: major facilitator superfamily 1 [Rhodospirillales bacterium]|nr:major facilitator superfamily 1 [Rhodospirillales bacterium]